VIVVEHDEDAIRAADYVSSTWARARACMAARWSRRARRRDPRNPGSLTGGTCPGAREIAVPAKRRKGNGKKLTVVGARGNNLKNVTASIPLGTFTCVTGVSGGGKSSFTIDTLYKAAARALNGARIIAGAHDKIEGSNSSTR
jgi:excinuclease ABC subunit A